MDFSRLSSGILLGLATLLAPLESGAATGEVPLVSVATDATDIDFHFMGLVDENGDLQGMKIYQAPNRPATYMLQLLQRGVTTLTVWGRRVISLRAPGFDPREGGELVITLLRDGIFNDRRDLHLEIRREGPRAEDWVPYLNERFGRVRFDGLYFKARKILGQPRGIGRIDIFLDKEHVLRTDTDELSKRP